jgi:hypothetical protein
LPRKNTESEKEGGRRQTHHFSPDVFLSRSFCSFAANVPPLCWGFCSVFLGEAPRFCGLALTAEQCHVKATDEIRGTYSTSFARVAKRRHPQAVRKKIDKQHYNQ